MLLAIHVAEIFERHGISRTQPQSFLQGGDGIIVLAFLRREHAEVVPGVGPGIRVTRPIAQRLLEAGARLFGHLLLEVDHPEQVARVGVLGLMLEHKLATRERRIEIAALHEDERVRELIAMELAAVKRASKWQSFSHAL